MPAARTTTVAHEEFCVTQDARGDGPAAEPRIEQYRSTGMDGSGHERTMIVTRCQDCGATRYTDPNSN